MDMELERPRACVFIVLYGTVLLPSELFANRVCCMDFLDDLRFERFPFRIFRYKWIASLWGGFVLSLSSHRSTDVGSLSAVLVAFMAVNDHTQEHFHVIEKWLCTKWFVTFLSLKSLTLFVSFFFSVWHCSVWQLVTWRRRSLALLEWEKLLSSKQRKRRSRGDNDEKKMMIECHKKTKRDETNEGKKVI